MSKKNSILVITAGIAIAVGMAIFLRQSEPPFPIWAETRDRVAFSGVDYGELLRRSAKGDTEALRQLMEMSDRFDAASAYGHGAAMVEVLWQAGDGPFAVALASLPDSSRRRALFLLACGLEYTQVRSHSNLPPARFPKVRLALDDYQLLDASATPSKDQAPAVR